MGVLARRLLHAHASSSAENGMVAELSDEVVLQRFGVEDDVCDGYQCRQNREREHHHNETHKVAIFVTEVRGIVPDVVAGGP